MHVHKAAFVEEFVNCESRFAADFKYGGKQIRTRAQMRYLAQKFHRMALLLQRIFGRGFPFHHDFLRLDLVGLLVFGRSHHRTRHVHRRAHVLARDFVVIIEVCALEYDLRVFKTTAVRKFYKPERLGIADGFDPPRDGNAFLIERRNVRGNLFQPDSFHNSSAPANDRYGAIVHSVVYTFQL